VTKIDDSSHKIIRKRLWMEREGLAPLEAENLAAKRTVVMNSNNPKFILRNWIAQNAIQKAEKGDFSEVNAVHKLLQVTFKLNN
jgi:uncharacterized protein YdiU (UPF0061 family)